MAFKKKTLRDVELKGKRVLVRVDFNVPMDELGNIEDDTRIRSSLPTIEYLLDAKAKVILMSHLGRPKGREEKFSLTPVAKRLSRYINREVRMLHDCTGEEVEKEVLSLEEGQVVLLENLRFQEGESKGSEEFAKALARLGEVYVSDAFGTCHRKHASVYLVPKILKPAVMGFLLEKEVSYFERAMVNPQRPVVAIIGGAKVSSKLGLIKNLLKRVDKLFIGGAMAFTFIRALGYRTGNSLVEEELINTARDIMEIARKLDVRLYLPVDFVVGREVSDNTPTRVVPWQEVPEGWMGLDVGPVSISLLKEVISDAQTIIWNGPMGVFELDRFKDGTYETARLLAQSPALTIAGGGDTDHAIHRAGVYNAIDFVSTGGGAFLELLESNTLPCLEVLDDA
ncbi:MAG: phosphoglycerate kinase [Aquificaceae bacterium]|nr:phosphoglycerate kinase [Aquificaceae bacterium]MCS7196342.1 phosphoglycerate kinase [Aquificaceae bacterium]MCX7989737.1 phosphoglycerate kinase [Aquificaceae bacterium]MDW8032015.1 phosphoglycerate kinase [Aquificaceae bacterium]MDW8294628.1 phosphoglycerate kinase [Aquificaceae bacterium]